MEKNNYCTKFKRLSQSNIFILLKSLLIRYLKHFIAFINWGIKQKIYVIQMIMCQ